MFTRLPFNLLLLGFGLIVANLAHAQQTELADGSNLARQHSILQIHGADKKRQVQSSRIRSTEPSIDASHKINQLITRLALEAIPHTYTRDKDWGGQERRWDGVRFRRDEGGKLETERKWKMVNHGTWKKYSASLVNPTERFLLHVKNIHQTQNKKLGFEVHVGAQVRFDARQAKWAKGLQLYSLSAEGHGALRLVVHCEMNVAMDINHFPPDLVFEPVATRCELIVDEFRIDRVSKLGGEIAQQVTRAARKTLDEKIAENEVKLTEKINKELRENADQFRLSISEAMDNRWAEDAKKFLPGPIKQAIDASRQSQK